MRYRWQDVDWVELGCRGWDIDETGAELSDGSDDNVAHLDRATGHLILSGSPAFVLRVLLDLRAARVPGYCVPEPTCTSASGGSVITVEYVWP